MIPERKSKNIFDTPGWKNTEKITILSENHLKKLLSQGFEFKGVSFAWVPDKTDIVLYLASKKKRLIPRWMVPKITFRTILKAIIVRIARKYLGGNNYLDTKYTIFAVLVYANLNAY